MMILKKTNLLLHAFEDIATPSFELPLLHPFMFCSS